MHNVSNEYKEAVYAPRRKTRGRVTFDISDVTARGDVNSITTSPQSLISDKQQLINKKREQSINIATWERDRFKLDGSFSFADDSMANNGELGFVSGNLSDENGEFVLQPTLVFTFNDTHSSMGITLTFDVPNNEYAKEFIINAYDGANNLILTKNVVDNDSVQVAEIGQFYLYKKIEIIIIKWCKPYRRARVVEVDFGVVRVYADDKLITMNYTEEMDIISKNIPAAEFKFTVDNLNKEFNILNPEGFYKFLQERQLVTPEVGVVIGDIDGAGATTEFIPLGEFYLMDWISDEGSSTSTFTARNIIDIMSSYDYENLEAKSNYSLYNMTVDIFNLCKVTNYYIDPALQSILTNGLVKKTNCRNVLQMIAMAGMCNVYVDRLGKLFVKKSPLAIGEPIDTISLKDMPKDPQIKLDSVVKRVEVLYYSNFDTNSLYFEEAPYVKEGENIKIENNTLINTLAQATNVARWLLRQLKYRAMYTANWRQNPAHELKDVVIMEDIYNQNNKAILTKVELTYQGYLEGKTEARGMVT